MRGDILDFSKLSVEKGSFDSVKGIITWKASDIPALSNIDPGAGGSVSFSIPVKLIIPVRSASDKDMVVKSVATIDSPDIPTPIDSNKIIGSNRLELRLATKVLLDVKGLYNDKQLKNSGPIPLKVGQETTFTVHWAVTSVSSDLSNASLVASLPSGTRWVGGISPSDSDIVYNDRTNQLIWSPGTVPAGAGILLPKKEVAFQIGVTPQSNQVDKALILVNKGTFSAVDTFSGKSINIDIPEKNTQLSEDSKVGYEGGKVTQ